MRVHLRRFTGRDERGPDVGVITSAHVDEVDHQHVQGLEVGGLRDEIVGLVAVEAHHAGAGARIHRVADADHVLSGAAEAVLGTKQRHRCGAELHEDVDRMTIAAVDARRVREQAHAPAAQALDKGA